MRVYHGNFVCDVVEVIYRFQIKFVFKFTTLTKIIISADIKEGSILKNTPFDVNTKLYALKK